MSDRKIDAVIGEAFGFLPRVSWEILNADEDATHISFDRRSSADDWFERHMREYPDYFKDYHVGSWKHWPQFSTDPAASKLLRDKLAERWHWQMFSPFGKVPVFSFGVWPKGERLELLTHIAHGETEELAVALCALIRWRGDTGIVVVRHLDLTDLQPGALCAAVR